MASLVVAGDTSGSVTLSAPSVSGSTVLTLPTTTGTLVVTGGAQTIEFADGSAAAPSITNSGDTNTGMFFPAADTIAFSEGGTEAMRLDSSGNVGIGTSSPSTYSAKLAVVSSSGAANQWLVGGSSSGAYAYYSNNAQTSSANTFIVGQGWATGSDNICFLNSNGANPLLFATTSTERMRITSDGNLLFGTTATNLYGNFANAKASATLSASETSGQTQFQNFSRVQTSTPVASSTVESFRFLRADGTVIGANRIIGHVYVYADAIGGGNSFIGIYTIISHGNGTSDATLTLVRSTTRGVSPVSSISLADDGAGGGVKINITYTNLGGAGVASRTTVSFVGQV